MRFGGIVEKLPVMYGQSTDGCFLELILITRAIKDEQGRVLHNARWGIFMKLFRAYHMGDEIGVMTEERKRVDPKSGALPDEKTKHCNVKRQPRTPKIY